MEIFHYYVFVLYFRYIVHSTLFSVSEWFDKLAEE